MSGPPRNHYFCNESLLCACRSFCALADASRHACSHCVSRLEDLLHAVREIVRVRGICDYSVFDKPTRRAIALAFEMEPIEDVPSDVAMETE